MYHFETLAQNLKCHRVRYINHWQLLIHPGGSWHCFQKLADQTADCQQSEDTDHNFSILSLLSNFPFKFPSHGYLIFFLLASPTGAESSIKRI